MPFRAHTSRNTAVNGGDFSCMAAPRRAGSFANSKSAAINSPGAPTIIRIHCQPWMVKPIHWLTGHVVAQYTRCPPRKIPNAPPPMKPSCRKPMARGSRCGGNKSASIE